MNRIHNGTTQVKRNTTARKGKRKSQVDLTPLKSHVFGVPKQEDGYVVYHRAQEKRADSRQVLSAMEGLLRV